MAENKSKPLTTGEELRARRQAAGLTQRALAEQIGCAQSLVSQLETGTRPVSEKVVRKYTAFFENKANG